MAFSNKFFLTSFRILIGAILLISSNSCSSGNQNSSSSKVLAKNKVLAENSVKPVKSIPIEEKLIGRWEAKHKDQTLVFLFTSDQRVIMWEIGDTEASDYGKYFLETKGYLKILKVTINGEVASLGALKFPSQETMRYQRFYSSALNNIYAFKSFNRNAIIFQKINDSGNLPSNLEVKSFD